MTDESEVQKSGPESVRNRPIRRLAMPVFRVTLGVKLACGIFALFVVCLITGTPTN